MKGLIPGCAIRKIIYLYAELSEDIFSNSVSHNENHPSLQTNASILELYRKRYEGTIMPPTSSRGRSMQYSRPEPTPAGMIRFPYCLVTSAADFITGANFVADGGMIWNMKGMGGLPHL
jgi:hypothetical protein